MASFYNVAKYLFMNFSIFIEQQVISIFIFYTTSLSSVIIFVYIINLQFGQKYILLYFIIFINYNKDISSYIYNITTT